VPETKQLSSPGIADLLKEIVALYRHNFGLIFSITVIVSLPTSLIYSLCSLYRPHWLIYYAVLIISIAAAPIVTGALIFAIADRELGLPTSLKACYRRILTKPVYLAMLGISIVQKLLVCGCISIAAIPGTIWAMAMGYYVDRPMPGFAVVMVAVALFGLLATSPLWVRLMLAGPVVVLEKKSTGLALGRSWHLTGTSWIKSILVIVVTSILIYAVPLILSQLVGPLTGHKSYDDVPLAIRAAQQGAGILISLFLWPLLITAQTLLYYDIRVRKEAFELTMLARDLEQKDVPAQ